MSQVIAFLRFDGDCREAMEFYKRCFEGELFLLPYAEAPVEFRKGTETRIMHSTLTKGSPILMAADIMPGTPWQAGNNFSVSVHPESLEETERLFIALSEGGKVTMPLQGTFWGARFGMLVDRFGISWMFNFAHPKQE
jgi:PhnB protein